MTPDLGQGAGLAIEDAAVPSAWIPKHRSSRSSRSTTRGFLGHCGWKNPVALDSNDQSKLLLSLPETVLAVAVQGETDAAADAKPGPARRRAQVPAKIAATP